MRKVKVAAVQMRCTRDVNANIANAERLVRKAAGDGAQIILLPELFERQYFCQERQYEYYEFAKPVEENDAVKHFAKVAEELKVVLPISFYEKDGKRLFNTVAILDADGTNLGIYRKTHIIGECEKTRNDFELREIRGLRHLRPAMAPSAWVSAGTSGSRRPRDLWR